MRCACIDIGSNTTRLLVADVVGTQLSAVREERVFTRIGVALEGDALPASKCAEVTAVVAGQLASARSLGAEQVHGVATAAIRGASNGVALLEQVRARTGLAVTVLPPSEEARLAFCGAAAMWTGSPTGPSVPPAPLGVIDVGGGSSEVVIGSPSGEIAWWASLALGSGSLAAMALHHDPPTSAELASARAAVAAACGRVGFHGPAPALVLAVGGSATSLGRLAGCRLDAGGFTRALALLSGAPAAEIAVRHDIDPARARLLPAGLIVLEAFAQRLGGVIEVGRGGIREGVLLEALA